MKKEDEVIENGDALDDDLLDFEFDDLIEEGLEEGTGNGSAEEDVLELVDVVEEGSLSHDLKPDEGQEFEFEMDDSELESLVEEETEGETDLALEDLAEPEDFEDEMDTELDALSQEVAVSELQVEVDSLDLPQAPDSDLDASDEDLASSEEADFDFKELAEAETLQEDVDEKDLVEAEPEFFSERVEEEALPDMIEPAESEADKPFADAISMGISEERIEAIVREVVEDVVGRVARETMADVAEKVIGEAIDALKQGLEALSE